MELLRHTRERSIYLTESEKKALHRTQKILRDLYDYMTFYSVSEIESPVTGEVHTDKTIQESINLLMELEDMPYDL